MKFNGKNVFFIVVSAVSIVWMAIVAFFVNNNYVKPAVLDSNNYNYHLSESEKSDYDYRVYNPLKSQVDEMKNETSIDRVFPYYNYKATLSFGNKGYVTRAIFTYDDTNLDISEYNENRLMLGSVSHNENFVLLDGISANRLGVTVGDSIQIKLNKTENMTVYVAGIVETNTFYDTGAVYLDYSKNVKSTIDSSYDSLDISGVLVKEKTTGCLDYLKEYIPLGAMLSREYFNTDAEYNNYVSNYMNNDYSNTIYNNKTHLSTLKNSYGFMYNDSIENAKKAYIVLGVASVALLVLTISAYVFLGKYRKLNKVTITSKEFIIIYEVKNLISFGIGFVILMISINSLFNSYLTYSGLKDYLVNGVVTASIISFLAISVIDFVALKLINNKKYVN